MGLKSESEVQQLIQLEAAKHGCILMRNNMGAGKFVDEVSGQQTYVRFGLNNISKEQNERIKSSDLIGIIKRVEVISYHSEGEPRFFEVHAGLFVAIEVKKEGWKFNPKDKREVAQKAFIDWIISFGGIAGFCASVDDFNKLISG